MPKEFDPLKPAQYRLALDIGSKSIGFAVIFLKEDVNKRLKPYAIARSGVRIFGDGRTPAAPGQLGSSLAAERRVKRSIRRQYARKRKRLQRLLRNLKELGFFPNDSKLCKSFEDLNPYELRHKGLTKELKPHEFGRLLMHMAKNRGFQSNRKVDLLADNIDSQAKAETSAMKSAIATLQSRLNGEFETLGAYLYERFKKGETIKSSKTQKGQKAEYEFSISRRMVKQEFDRLWATQEQFNPELFNEQAKNTLKDTIFFQRNLLPQKVGKCTFLPEHERASKALPSSQYFRIISELNKISFTDAEGLILPISLEQRNKLLKSLRIKQKLSFDRIRTELNLDSTVLINLEHATKDSIEGDKTGYLLSKKEYFGPAWRDLSLETQDAIVTALLIHENEAELVQKLVDDFNIAQDVAKALANARLESQYMRLSKEAIERLIPELEKGVDSQYGYKVPVKYHEATEAAGFGHHSALQENWADFPTLDLKQLHSDDNDKYTVAELPLPYYGKVITRQVAFGTGDVNDPVEKRFGKIANPTVHICLNQVRVLLDEIIAKYGYPYEVNIELARELKQNHEQRQRSIKQQAANKKENEEIRREIKQAYKVEKARIITDSEISRADIEKWRLWRRSKSKLCVYSGKKICETMILNNEVEVDHILPRSRTGDNSYQNKVLVLNKANRIKSNRTPWEAKELFEAQGWSYEDILNRMRALDKHQLFRFAENSMDIWDKNYRSFEARALNDTRYISRVVKDYLKVVCHKDRIVVSNGAHTALIRGELGLNNLLGKRGEKNRDDHRHHAIDACVIGALDRSMLRKIQIAMEAAERQNSSRYFIGLQEPWFNFSTQVRRAVGQIYVSHKPNHNYEGEIFEASIYGLRLISDKKTEKYVGIKRNPETGKADKPKKSVVVISDPKTQNRYGLRHKFHSEGRPKKYYGLSSSSVFCLEIYRDEKGNWQAYTIPRYEAYRIVKRRGVNALYDNKRSNFEGRPLVMRLMRDDCIVLENNDKKEIYRVQKINGAQKSITLTRHYDANADDRYRRMLKAQKAEKAGENFDSEDLCDDLVFSSFGASSLYSNKARKVTISPMGVLRDPGFKG